MFVNRWIGQARIISSREMESAGLLWLLEIEMADRAFPPFRIGVLAVYSKRRASIGLSLEAFRAG